MRGLNLIGVGKGFYLVQFACEAEVQYIIKEQPWFVFGHFLAMRRWIPNFDSKMKGFESLVIWARIFGLLMKYYYEDSLKKLRKASESIPLLWPSHPSCNIGNHNSINGTLKLGVDLQEYGRKGCG